MSARAPARSVIRRMRWGTDARMLESPSETTGQSTGRREIAEPVVRVGQPDPDVARAPGHRVQARDVDARDDRALLEAVT